jgi:DNA-binding response OmpR family regulator
MSSNNAVKQSPKENDEKKTIILFVDDDVQLLYALQMRFFDLGYQAVIASNAKDALDLARKFPISVAVLDITMPEMDGFTLLKELRKIIPDLPTAFLTGKKDRETAFKAFELRSNCLIEKPCTPQELDEHIKRLLSAHKGHK